MFVVDTHYASGMRAHAQSDNDPADIPTPAKSQVTPVTYIKQEQSPCAMAILQNSKALLTSLDRALLAAEYNSNGDEGFGVQQLDDMTSEASACNSKNKTSNHGTQPPHAPILQGISSDTAKELLESFPDAFNIIVPHSDSRNQTQSRSFVVKTEASTLTCQADTINNITIKTISYEKEFGPAYTRDVALWLKINSNVNLCFTLSRLILDSMEPSSEVDRVFILSDYLHTHIGKSITIQSITISATDNSATLQLQDGLGLVFTPMEECVTRP